MARDLAPFPITRDLLGELIDERALAVLDKVTVIETGLRPVMPPVLSTFTLTPHHCLWLAAASQDFRAWMVGTGRWEARFADAVPFDLLNLTGHASNLAGDRTWLRGRNLAGALLYGVDFHGADMTGAGLHGAMAATADFGRARLCFADLTACCLVGADLRDANLMGATVDGADWSGADLTGARWVDNHVEPPAGWTVRRGVLARAEACAA